MDAPLVTAFEAAHYRVRLHARWHTMRVGQRHPRLDRQLRAQGCTTHWHLLTACNPHAQARSEADNVRSLRQLNDAVASLGLKRLDSLSSDAAGGWREPGFLLLDGPHAALVRLGLRFGQRALLQGLLDGVADLCWLSTPAGTAPQVAGSPRRGHG